MSPTLETLERVLAAADHQLEVVRRPSWAEVPMGRGRMAFVPDELFRLTTRAAVATVELPLHVAWSSRDRAVDPSQRDLACGAYEAILREAMPADIERLVDGALLVDAWDDLVLPAAVRDAWQPLIDEARSDG